ncbi:MAG: endonuclease/exonuclease/phosphatase family protein, partial [Pseudomonadota bacterium]
MAFLRGLVWLGLCAAAVTVLAALWSGLHPALDSFGVWLVYGTGMALALAVLCLLLRHWAGAAMGGLLLLVGTVQLAPHARAFGATEGDALRVLQHNLKYLNAAPDLADRLQGVEIATLQEVKAAQASLDALPEGWTVILCPGTRVGGQAVATVLPVTETGCARGVAWARVETPEGPFSVVSLHLNWPWPFNQAQQLEEILPDLSEVPRPILVAGDFNQTPWSAAVARVAEATGTTPLPDLRPTFALDGGVVGPLRLRQRNLSAPTVGDQDMV